MAAGGDAQNTPAPAMTAKKPVHKRAVAKKPPQPSVADQIQQLRQDLENQIQDLKQQLSDRDRQLQQAQQAAADAQAAANDAKQQSAQQATAIDSSTQILNSLKGNVADLQTSTANLTTTIQADQTKVQQQQKEIETPDAIHYKGITLSPAGSFIAGETVYRNHATGGGLNTPFTGIPLNDAATAQYSEFYGTGRQSRIALMAEGKLDNMTLDGYYEADWLGTGVTSNNNQSNSYVFRERQVWARAALNNGWKFTGGQMWSLATETTHGVDNKTEILPSTIDSQYTAGFVWTRQYGFRVSKDFGNKMAVGVSLENPQTLNLAGHNLPTNIVVGEAGTNGGLYNLTTNYSANLAPDIIAKVALDPGWGHYEIFGIARFFRDRIYPNDTGSAPSSAGAYNDTVTGGGIGGSLRVPTLHKHLDVGVKGLYGEGIGRYGSTQIADTTVSPTGQLALLHGFSALGTLEFHATPRLDIYANYGGDYAGRRYFIQGAGKPVVGYGAYSNVETGCSTEPVPASSSSNPFTGGGFLPGSQSNCTADTKDVQEFTAGYWFNFYNGPKGRLRQGLQYAYFQRNVWSGVGPTPVGSDNMFWTSFRYYVP
jgi:hypothetical protein